MPSRADHVDGADQHHHGQSRGQLDAVPAQALAGIKIVAQACLEEVGAYLHTLARGDYGLTRLLS